MTTYETCVSCHNRGKRIGVSSTTRSGARRRVSRAAAAWAGAASTWHRPPPHTTDSRARECTSCHASAKALGYGTHDGRCMKGYTQGIYVGIFGTMAAAILALLLVVFTPRRRQRRRRIDKKPRKLIWRASAPPFGGADAFINAFFPRQAAQTPSG